MGLRLRQLGPQGADQRIGVGEARLIGPQHDQLGPARLDESDQTVQRGDVIAERVAGAGGRSYS